MNENGRHVMQLDNFLFGVAGRIERAAGMECLAFIGSDGVSRCFRLCFYDGRVSGCIGEHGGDGDAHVFYGFDTVIGDSDGLLYFLMRIVVVAILRAY